MNPVPWLQMTNMISYQGLVRTFHKYIEFELNDSAVRNYLSCHNHQGKQLLDKCPHLLKKSFAYPDLLIRMIDNISDQNHIHPDFKNVLTFSLLSIFSDVDNLRAFLTSGMPTFSGKVRSIFLSDVSKHWKLGNDSNLLIVFYVQIMPDDFVMQLHRF